MKFCLKNKAYELWMQLSAILESTCATTEIIKPILLEIKNLFPYKTEIGKKARLILIAESDFDFIELDDLCYLIHKFWDSE